MYGQSCRVYGVGGFVRCKQLLDSEASTLPSVLKRSRNLWYRFGTHTPNTQVIAEFD